MIGPDRRKKLLALVAEHGDVSVGELAQWLPSSPATVRRDIHWLAERSMIKRVHGRAQRLEAGRPEPLPGAELLPGAGQKRAIARHASALCQDGETIVIHGGSTTGMMAEFLADKRLTTLTNSFQLARRLLETTQIDVMLTAGTVIRSHDLIMSPFDDAGAPRRPAARSFVGVAGIAEHGLMQADALLVQAQSRLLRLADRIVVLADSSKFARKAGLVLCALNRVGSVITDTGAPDAAVQMLERAGVEVVTVEPDRYCAPLQ